MFKINHSSFVKSVAQISQLPEEKLPEFAFIGRSNVGKSSLINTLTNKKSLVKVSNTPGKTQLINYFNINDSLYFVDLPGYGFARASKSAKDAWSKNIRNYLLHSEYLNLLFVLIDSRHGIKANDMEMFQFLYEYEIPCCVIATKRDKLSGNAWTKQRKLIGQQLNVSLSDVLAFSSVTRQGKNELLTIIEDVLNGDV